MNEHFSVLCFGKEIEIPLLQCSIFPAHLGSCLMPLGGVFSQVQLLIDSPIIHSRTSMDSQKKLHRYKISETFELVMFIRL